MEIARAYGMVAPDAVDASTVRMTLFLDPEGVLRASTTYPAEVGRSIPEVIRTVQALQRVHGGGALAPADWTPGADLLREPAQDMDEVLAGSEPAYWFCTPLKDGKAE